MFRHIWRVVVDFAQGINMSSAIFHRAPITPRAYAAVRNLDA